MDVVLGLAGGTESMRALEETLNRTRETDDTLTIALLEKPEADRSPDEMRAAVERQLEEAGVAASIHHLEGDPGSALVEFADGGDFDQLVIGGGSESPMGKIRVGPITEFVLLNARVTVKLVR